MRERPPGGGEGPPDEPGANWDAIVEEVEAALDEAGVLGDAARGALLEALEDALSQLGEGLDGDVQVQIRTTLGDGYPDDGRGPDTRPEVTVVDGGRGRNQPRSPRPRPELRVAEGGSAGQEDPGPSVSVQVVRLGDPARRAPRRPALADEGWIRVDADDRQALYRGDEAHAYRVGCTAGRLALSVDGVTVETLSPGQSCDVEGRAVVVLAADDGPAAGAYARL